MCQRVAIIGGGITAVCAASTLLSSSQTHAPSSASTSTSIQIDLFDQGRRGPGGRASHRNVTVSCDEDSSHQHTLRFDHGAQFFRADTDRFRSHVWDWIEQGFVREWKGTFVSDSNDTDDTNRNNSHSFFGMPSQGPFFVGSNGMNSVVTGILDSCCSSDTNDNKDRLQIFKGTRVANMDQDPSTGKWKLYGTSGECAYHDTAEDKVRGKTASNPKGNRLGRSADTEYDIVILTDVSSSFGAWHRASAGVPESFASRVRERVGARVPLFTAMMAFESKLETVSFDAAAFVNNSTIWFAARSSSKPGLAANENDACADNPDCWTIVSTPEYALKKIEETPMQDAVTGAFIPQSSSYLTTGPGPDLEREFRNVIATGVLGNDIIEESALPKTLYLDAQRWGSALPCHRYLDETSATRKIIAGTAYDGHRAALAPTKIQVESGDKEDNRNFLVDETLGLIQAGDMMSLHTPGFEAAALSGVDAAEHALKILSLVAG